MSKSKTTIKQSFFYGCLFLLQYIVHPSLSTYFTVDKKNPCLKKEATKCRPKQEKIATNNNWHALSAILLVTTLRYRWRYFYSFVMDSL